MQHVLYTKKNSINNKWIVDGVKNVYCIWFDIKMV